ncbi:MAG: DUF3080 family protein, partial [Pontibacterium sp.]
ETEQLNLSWQKTPELPYQQLYTLQYGGRLLTSVALLTQTMERGTQAINARLARKAFCRKGLANQRKEILGNVFAQFYSGRFQPYLASVDQPYQTLASQLQTMVEGVPPTASVKAYFDQVWSEHSEFSLRSRYINARQAHVKAWQVLLGQCNMMPGQ